MTNEKTGSAATSADSAIVELLNQMAEREGRRFREHFWSRIDEDCSRSKSGLRKLIAGKE